MSNKILFNLIIAGPDGFSETISLVAGSVLIGRSEDCDIQLEDGQVQRKHAQIDVSVTDCTITDLSRRRSRTVVNGELVEAKTAVSISPNDSIQLGPFTLGLQAVATNGVKKNGAGKNGSPTNGSTSSLQIIAHQPSGNNGKTNGRHGNGGQPPSNLMPDFLRSAPPPPPDYSLVSPPGLGRHSVQYLQYLPGIFHTDFASRFLAIFEAILMPVSWNVENFELFLAADTAPAPFIDWLAGWFGIEFDHMWSEEQRRTVLREMHTLLDRRGTKWGLTRLLEIYTGRPPEIVEVDQEPHTFTVRFPFRERDLNRPLIEKLIEAYKPAHTNYLLEFDSKLDIDVMWSQLEF
ncbi:MAG: phage tail protein [Chloroflexota bacterium]